MRTLPLVTLALAAAAVPALLEAQRPAAPPRTALTAAAAADVVKAFYTFHFAHDMAFTRAAVRARGAWLSPDLLERCRAYFARPGDPNEVPAIDGDPFTDSQEYPRSFNVVFATVEGDSARVQVAMLWPPAERRIVTVVLAPVGRAWRITDLLYSRGEPSLRELLASGK